MQRHNPPMRSVKETLLRRERPDDPQACGASVNAEALYPRGAHSVGPDMVVLAELWPERMMNAFEAMPAVYE